MNTFEIKTRITGSQFFLIRIAPFPNDEYKHRIPIKRFTVSRKLVGPVACIPGCKLQDGHGRPYELKPEKINNIGAW